MSKTKIALAALLWLFVLTVGVGIWKLVLQPAQKAEQAKEQETKEKEKLDSTQGTSRYQHEIAIGLDAFSGYAVLRSQEFRDQLASQGIRLSTNDDAADYAKRMDQLESGAIQFAAFPIDALIKVCSARNKLPVTIIALIDETRGADAMVAYTDRFPDVDALNSATTKFVLVGDSPSETLTRVVMKDFDLANLAPDPFRRVDSPEKIMASYQVAAPTTDEVYVTWEPFVSQLLENPAMHVIVDSSKFTGYIVDSLVVSRDYLVKQPQVVEQVLESYFRSMNAFRDPTKLKQLVLDDAKRTGTKLTDVQADRLLAGIRWKNTLENYAHFGLREDRVVHIEDMIARIMSVLMATKGIDRDPTGGQYPKLFFDKALAKLKSGNFLPDELVRSDGELVELTEDQWGSLTPVGTLSVPELVFARGTARLTEASKQTLDELAKKLLTWPAYYIKVEGNAASGGNEAANLALARERADAAVDYLKMRGISASRMKSVRGKVGQSRVVFILGELPY
ncbi:phosphate ABC transporter substrate-binding/OmpA family protein [Pirellulaceae bacterium SH449]